MLVIAATFVGPGTWPAQAAKEVEFTSEKLLHFGMKVEDAEKLVEDEEDWQIAYKIQTASTMDLACRYNKEVYFQARFYQGRCYFLEKRIEASLEEVKQVFSHYLGQFGVSPEGTQSRDGRLMFARWDKDEREITLTGGMRSNGKYILTYEDFAPAIIGEANYVQEQELRNSQAGTNPITGAPR